MSQDLRKLVQYLIYKNLSESFNNKTDDKIGKEFWFEYHCWENPESNDAQLWYRSHQKVNVLSISEPGNGNSPQERGENGEPRVYKVKFNDGFVGDVFEDELLNSIKEFVRPDPPKI